MVVDSPKMYPSIAECLQFSDDFGMYENIRAHSLQVARVSLAVYDGLVEGGTAINLPDRNLVLSASLLHDIAKTQCLKEDCRHAIVGKEICVDLGFADIGDIIEQHVVLSSFDPEIYSQGSFNGAALVYYADKRVRHDEIVSLADRLEYIIKVYGKNDDKTIAAIRKNFWRCEVLEEYLFQHISFRTGDIAEMAARHISI